MRTHLAIQGESGMLQASAEPIRPLRANSNNNKFQPSSRQNSKIHFRLARHTLTHSLPMWSQESSVAEHGEKHVVDSVACKVELLYSHESGSILRRCLTPKTSVRMAWDHNNLLTLITETHDVSCALHAIVHVLMTCRARSICRHAASWRLSVSL